MSEDQQLARDILAAGHAVVYQPILGGAFTPTTTRCARLSSAISTASTR